LSPEKGILEFLAATEGLARVIVGDGPLRALVPESVGVVARDRLGSFYDRAAVVCVPSRREGFGMWCLEAMAHGRPGVTRGTGGPGGFGSGHGRTDGPPVPPAQLRVRFGPSHADLATFLRSGAQHARLIRDLLAEQRTDVEAASPLLDFGCGCGRVARHWHDSA